jgi:tRNA A37 threonylcarbamoyladenosine biosynthesis protein TsaE
VIEWAEKGLPVLPTEHLMIKIQYLSDNARSFEFLPSGRKYEKLLSDLKSLLAKG